MHPYGVEAWVSNWTCFKQGVVLEIHCNLVILIV